MAHTFNFSFDKKEFGAITKLRLVLALGILIVGVVIYLFVTQEHICQDFECFRESMTSCKKTVFIREDLDMVWEYTIKSRGVSDSCMVEVKLLKVIEGKVEAQDLVTKSMLCDYPVASNYFPEDVITRCSGILKEDLQELIIKRMHDYLITHIGTIEEEFSRF